MVEIPIDPHSRPEETLFEDERIKITSRRVFVNNTNYRLRFVTSVRTERKKPFSFFEHCLLVGGVVAAIVGICVISIYGISAGYNLISVGVLMAALGIFITVGFKYAVMITIDDEDVQLLIDKDQDYITEITTKVRRAAALHQKKLKPYLKKRS